MSKITLTKQLRKGFLQIEDHSDPLMKKAKIVNVSPNARPRQKVGDCYICHEPVFASDGQLLKWVSGKNGEHLYSHKQCRKNQ